MSLDPQVQILLDLAKKAALPEVWQLTPDQGREQYLTRVNKLKFNDTILRTEDRRIPGPGSDIAIRIYTPREQKPSEKMPILIWYHGGGFVAGTLVCLNVESIRQFMSFVTRTEIFSKEVYFLSKLPAEMAFGETTAVVVLALMLFPASFGIVISIFMEKIADIVESEHYPELGPARGIPIWTGIWTGIVFLLAVVALNLVMLPFYIVAIFVAGLGAVLFYAVNGWLTGRVYYEQVALRRRSPAEVKAWRRANSGVLWLTGIVIVFLGTLPILNLIVPVLGVAAMVHVAQTLKPPVAPGRPFNPPTGAR